ncbi:MAG: DUF1800 domain-containing protein [Acidobacteria bacterium]|nr:DUF1800 domain-containing protein [Acidobacteriota bacterium]
MASIDYAEAAHLLRRMGFGGSEDERNTLVAKGSREAAVDYLLNYSSIDNTEMETLLSQSFDFSAGPSDNQRFNQAEIRRWWTTRMVVSKRQFEEKMTLFWHNHFANALSKVQDVFMYVQNLTLRQNALGRFDDLLMAVAKDPAMLLFLDTTTSTRNAPNENWARELQELFTMGINDLVTGQPNYSETDVKEIAKCFSGWRFRRTPGSQSPFAYSFFTDANQINNGAKTVYGQTANYTGEDIITLVSAKPATARYLVKKLFDFFVYPIDVNSSADKATLDKFANVYLNANHSIKELVSAIFKSDEFFSSRARFGLIKNPMEFVVGAVRMLKANYAPGTSTTRETTLFTRAGNMGMRIFDPPDVSGWDLNAGWVSTATQLERFNFANQFITSRPNNPTAGAWITTEQLTAYTRANVKKTVGKFLDLLGPLEVESATVKELRRYLQTDDQGNSFTWAISDTNVDKKVRGLVHEIMCLPAFSLN